MLRSCFLAASLILAGSAHAQDTTRPATPQETQPPVLPGPQPGGSAIPEKIRPSEPSTTGTTLSDKLERSDGVIRPQPGISPDMSVPVPDTGTTRVIPAPGSPGGNPAVDPK